MAPLIDPDLASPDRRILITGGVRSGKSRYAETLLADLDEVTYVASGPVPDPAADAEWAARIARSSSAAAARTGARSKPPTWLGRCAAYRARSDRLPGHLADCGHRSARHAGRSRCPAGKAIFMISWTMWSKRGGPVRAWRSS